MTGIPLAVALATVVGPARAQKEVTLNSFKSASLWPIWAAGNQGFFAKQGLTVKNVYADYRTMLQKERPQIVACADRYPDSHRDMVVACAEAGAHIFLEKPMCRTLQEADEMVAAIVPEDLGVNVTVTVQEVPGPKAPPPQLLVRV